MVSIYQVHTFQKLPMEITNICVIMVSVNDMNNMVFKNPYETVIKDVVSV